MNEPSLLEYYARRAAEYETIYQKPERQPHLAELKAHLRHLLAGHDVLEIACGTGYWTEVIAPVCRSVLATDACEDVLALAKAKSYEQGRVRFMRADAYDLRAVPAGSTAGFAGFWWSHVPRQWLSAFLHAFHARLEPGARVCFIDNQYVAGSSTPVSHVDHHGNMYQLRRLRDGSQYTVLKNFPTVSELEEFVRDQAADVEIDDFHYYWCLTYRCT